MERSFMVIPICPVFSLVYEIECLFVASFL